MTIKPVDPPTKVLQDNFSPAKGNALQACVAGLFGHSLKDVPNFIELDVGYEEGIRNYVRDHANCAVLKSNATEISPEQCGKLCILRGKSPRGDYGHVVIARITNELNFEMIFNPHPDATFLDKDEPYGWYMVFTET